LLGLGVEQPAGLDRRRNRPARLLQRRRLQQHRSLLGLEPVDYVAARIKAWVASGQPARAPGRDGSSIFTARTPDVPQVCDAVAALVSPSAKSLVIPTVSLPVQSAAQGEHPVVGVVQHFGSWRLLSEGLGQLRSARIKRLPPKKTDTVSREGRTRRRCCFFGS
jgi:hypothetical protein